MIPLRLKATAPAATAPFVVRLRAAAAVIGSPPRLHEDADLASVGKSAAIYRTYAGELHIEGIEPNDTDGDVLLVVPEQRIAHRLIRARSQHNTLLVTERCDQLCVMCSQPPKPRHVNYFDHFAAAVLLAPADAVIGVSGGEPTLYKPRLFQFIKDALRQRPDLTFHVLTNAQHFEWSDEEALRHWPADRVIWGIPLYSPIGSQHDELVGKAGAFDRLRKSFAVLAKTGALIELRTVVMRPNAPTLPLLSTFISRHLPFVSVWAIMQLESIGYARMNWSELFFDSSSDFASIGRALDICRARGIDVQLYNFPICTVPNNYRTYARPTISDWKQKFLDHCQGCTERSSCSGFFEWYPDSQGFKQVGL